MIYIDIGRLCYICRIKELQEMKKQLYEKLIIFFVFAVNKCASKEDKKPRDSCQYWQGIGYCTQSEYKSFMDGNCARTCCEKGKALLPQRKIKCIQ